MEIQTDNCETVLGEPAEQPLVQIISGAGAKQRPIHSTFMAHQERKYPELETVFAEGLLWGFGHMQVDGDSARVTLLSVPGDGHALSVPLIEYSFDRRSHRYGQND